MAHKLRWFCLAVLMAMADRPIATAASATFVIDPHASNLTIEATTVFGFTFTDSDTQSLQGTIDADFDFGTTGTFPETADFTITGAAISPSEPFSLTLGIPPSLGVAVTINDAVTDVQTRNPPAMLTSLPTGLVRYEFDAAAFDIILNQGTVVATGVVTDTVDLAAEPVSGAADPGTFGQITLLDIQTEGATTAIDAQLALPIMFNEVFDVDGQVVTLDVSGDVFAYASFSVALSGLPGDFDDDSDVDGIDFLQIQRSDATLIAAWQAAYGTETAGSSATLSVPEPSSLVLWGSCVGLLGLVARHVRS